MVDFKQPGLGLISNAYAHISSKYAGYISNYAHKFISRTPGFYNKTIPSLLYGPLFYAVQAYQLFPDQKTFVDCHPRFPPEFILEEYALQKDLYGFNLHDFMEACFDLPQSGGHEPVANLPINDHIEQLWVPLTRTSVASSAYDSLISLPNPFIVPGGRFQEQYYWDSYFIMLGLKHAGQHEALVSMVLNFAWMIDTIGHIPNGNRSYYLSRSQPPFFALMVELLADGQSDILVRFLPQLQKEHSYWMQGEHTVLPGNATAHVVRLADGSLLNRYWDELDIPRDESWHEDTSTVEHLPPDMHASVLRHIRAAAESGWDFSSRWMEDGNDMATMRTTDIVPVDLNCLLYKLEAMTSTASALSGNTRQSNEFSERAEHRKVAIETYLWHNNGYYCDYDWTRTVQRDNITAAMLFPLFVQIASDEKAAQVALATERYLLQPNGIIATTELTSQQWDASNIWAPLQWIAVSGLSHYSLHHLAGNIAARFVVAIENYYDGKNKLIEKYQASGDQGGGGGEYALQDGFGWTNGVYVQFKALLSSHSAFTENVRMDAANT